MARIMLLAVSHRPVGMCLGGIDLETHEWVRPIGKCEEGIREFRCFLNGRFLRVGDILELDLLPLPKPTEFQRENWLIANWNWRATKRVPLATLVKYIEPSTPVLYSPGDRVCPGVMQALPPAEWKSLQLVEPLRLSFKPQPDKPDRWVANFFDQVGNKYSLKVTDPVANQRLNEGKTFGPRCLVTVSLTKPWTYDAEEHPAMCYKIAAAIIPLDE